jgi:hypothetical protein
MLVDDRTIEELDTPELAPVLDGEQQRLRALWHD